MSPTAHDPRRWLVLAVALTAGFMAMLDVFIVNVAIPSIQQDLHASFGDVELVIAAYQLAYGVWLITGGRLGDIYGRKRLFATGMAGFTLASGLAGLAPTAAMLIAARAAQGLAAAFMVPQVLALIRVTFADDERGLAFALFGVTAGLAAIVGQIAGGLLITANLLGLGWRSAFLVNVPVSLLSLPAALAVIGESRGTDDRKVDLAGIGIISAGLFLLVYPLVEGPGAGWPLWALGSLATAVVVLAGFLSYEQWCALRGRVPLVDLSLFGNRAFVVGLVMTAVLYMGIQSFTLLLGIYLQAGRGLTALAASLVFTPTAVGFTIASAISAKLARRLGRGALTLGTMIYLAGTLLTVFGVDQGVDAPTSRVFLLAMFLNGFGAGLLWAPLSNIVLTNIRSGNAGSASGVLTTVQQVTGALGVAVLGMVFWTTLAPHSAALSVQTPAGAIPHAFATATVWRAGLLLTLIPLGFLLPRPAGAVPDNGALLIRAALAAGAAQSWSLRARSTVERFEAAMSRVETQKAGKGRR